MSRSAAERRLAEVADLESVGAVRDVLLFLQFHAPPGPAGFGMVAAIGLVAVLHRTGASFGPLAWLGLVVGLAFGVVARRKELNALRGRGRYEAETLLVRAPALSPAGTPYTTVELTEGPWVIADQVGSGATVGIGRLSGRPRFVRLAGVGEFPAWTP